MSILFYGKSAKKTTDNLVPIYLRVTINGQRFEISTQRYVERSKWSSEAGRMKGNSEEAKRINVYLDTCAPRYIAIRKKYFSQEYRLPRNHLKKSGWVWVKRRICCAGYLKITMTMSDN